MSKRTYELIGWWLFVISAIGFLIASWGALWGMIGSLAFFVACIFFLIPYYLPTKEADKE